MTKFKSNHKNLFIKITNNTLFFLLSSLIIGMHACQQNKETGSNQTTISGNIQYPIGDKIYFYTYSDSAALYLEQKSALDSAMIDSKGNFSFSLVLDGPKVFDLETSHANLASNLFICPGDKIQIQFEDSNHTPKVNESTAAGKFNSFLINFQYTFFKEPEMRTEYYIRSNYMDGHNFSIYTDNRKNAQLNFFNDFFKNDSLRKEYNNYAISTIEYGFAVDRLLYVWKKRIKNQTVSLDSNYYTFETKSFIENIDAFNCPGYIHFLKFYIKDKYERKLEGGEIAVDNSKKMIPAVEKFTLTTKLLDRPFSDVVIYNIILNDMHDVSNTETSGYTDSLPLDSMIIYFKEKYSLLR